MKELIKLIEESKSKNEILVKYYGYANKMSYNKLNKFIIDNNINISHLEKKIKYCPNCNEIVTKKGNKFCNSSCAASFNNSGRDLTNETKTKISNGVKNSIKSSNSINKNNIIYTRICIVCGSEYIRHRKANGFLTKSKCCSSICRRKLNSHNGSLIMLKNIENGIHKGWISRNIISYPEQFFIEVLKNNNIEFQHNYPVNKKDLGLNNSYNYFLDFFIKDKKIDLEIDGNQHKYREEHDIKRDNLLKEYGFNVYRIKWENINTEKGKKYIEEEINKFLEFYENL
jgi:hypothetical protein